MLSDKREMERSKMEKKRKSKSEKEGGGYIKTSGDGIMAPERV